MTIADSKKYLLRLPPELHARLLAAKKHGLSINQFIVDMLQRALNIDTEQDRIPEIMQKLDHLNSEIERLDKRIDRASVICR